MKFKNEATIGGIVLSATILVGMLVFAPQFATADLTALDKIGTIINILTNIQNTTNNIEEDLTDKLTLRVEEDEEDASVTGEGDFTIRVDAEVNEAFQPFNLKELYVCGTLDEGGGDISVEEIRVELIEGGPNADIVIRTAEGFDLNDATIVEGIDAESCADILTLVAEQTGRAGAAGLGSDSDMEIVLEASAPSGNVSTIVHVKCIAFVPQIVVEEMTCDVAAVTPP